MSTLVKEEVGRQCGETLTSSRKLLNTQETPPVCDREHQLIARLMAQQRSALEAESKDMVQQREALEAEAQVMQASDASKPVLNDDELVHRLLAPQGPAGQTGNGHDNEEALHQAETNVQQPSTTRRHDHLVGNENNNYANKKNETFLEQGTKYGPLGNMHPNFVQSVLQEKSFFVGGKAVSMVCSGLTEMDCLNRNGCAWENACVDATSWICAVRKKVLDCSARHMAAPMLMQNPALDQLCGKVLLGQNKSKVSNCSPGYRLGFRCEADEQCGPPGTKRKCVKAQDQSHSAYEGCANVVNHRCSDMEWQEAGVLSL